MSVYVDKNTITLLSQTIDFFQFMVYYIAAELPGTHYIIKEAEAIDDDGYYLAAIHGMIDKVKDTDLLDLIYKLLVCSCDEN